MNIKLFVMDVDGTLTDGMIYMGEGGELCKAFNIKDGYGIAHILPEYGIIPVIITGRTSRIVENRAKELRIEEFHQGALDKIPVLEKVAEKYGCTFEEIAYIGDDLNDLPCIEKCGLTACPADSAKEITCAVDYVCEKIGGCGAVREFIDYIIEKTH